jgi:hypothetical protein
MGGNAFFVSPVTGNSGAGYSWIPGQLGECICALQLVKHRVEAMPKPVQKLPRRVQPVGLLALSLLILLNGLLGVFVGASEPESITFESSATADASGGPLQIVGNYLYVAGFGNGFHILDISNPQQPRWVGGWNNTTCPVGVYVAGQYAYLANRTSGLDILDIQNPRSPAHVGYLFTGGDAQSVHVVGHFAYLADGPKGFQIIDVSNPAKPERVGGYEMSGWARSVHSADGLAYVACANAGVRIFDVNNPSQPEQIGLAASSAGIIGSVQILGKFVYFADGHGFHQIAAKARSSPEVFSPYHLQRGWNAATYVQGRYVFALHYSQGFEILEIDESNYAHLRGAFKTSYNGWAVRVAGKYAYLMDNGASVHVIDLGDLASPKEVGVFNPRNYPSKTLALTNVVAASSTLSRAPNANTNVGAIINAPPELTNPHRTSDGVFTFILRGIPEATYFIEASTNLVAWAVISTNTLPTSGVLEIADPAARAFSQRYYRAIKEQ